MQLVRHQNVWGERTTGIATEISTERGLTVCERKNREGGKQNDAYEQRGGNTEMDTKGEERNRGPRETYTGNKARGGGESGNPNPGEY